MLNSPSAPIDPGKIVCSPNADLGGVLTRMAKCLSRIKENGKNWLTFVVEELRSGAGAV